MFKNGPFLRGWHNGFPQSARRLFLLLDYMYGLQDVERIWLWQVGPTSWRDCCTSCKTTVLEFITTTTTAVRTKKGFVKDLLSTSKQSGKVSGHILNVPIQGTIVIKTAFVEAQRKTLGSVGSYEPTILQSLVQIQSNTIYAFSIYSQILYYMCHSVEKRPKINKRGCVWPIFIKHNNSPLGPIRAFVYSPLNLSELPLRCKFAHGKITW